MAEFLKKPIAVPNEVDDLVFHGQLRGKELVLVVPLGVDYLVFHGQLGGKELVLVVPLGGG